MKKSASREDKCAMREQKEVSARLEDAREFLKDVKYTFKDDPHKYEQFLKVMKDFKAVRISTANVIKRVKILFQGHKHLILSFNKFLPVGYEIGVSSEKGMQFSDALAYANVVKATFEDDNHKYKEFLKVMDDCKVQRIDALGVIKQIELLFQGHQDLILSFYKFVPGNQT